LHGGESLKFRFVPRGGFLAWRRRGIPLEGSLKEVGKGRETGGALEQGGHFGGMILGRGGEAVELLLESFLLGGGNGGGGDGAVFLKKVSEDGGQGDGPEGPPSEEAKEQEDGEQLDERPFPNSHGLI